MSLLHGGLSLWRAQVSSGTRRYQACASASCARRACRLASHTACAEACPTGATKFGDRDELLKEAQQRIQDNPDKYLHHIYGETEVGGTSVLLLSSAEFTNFGYRDDLTQRALPMYTYQVLQHIPQFVPLFGTLLGGIYWITHRREDVAEAEENEKRGGEQ